ncbi:hypothetical protein CHARACLAT_024509 [Characodon lateralis]|uniref:Uncharacterized protein n=1 Tax=Characodon lateralis TaxID=208331 RepID=A0ABU7EQB9_9TELE|nr:hypothetical protein [Characodon lateralis]
MFPPTMDLVDEHQASSMDLFTFLSREVEKLLPRSAELSVPQSAYDGSRLAIPWATKGDWSPSSPFSACSPGCALWSDSEAHVLLPPQETPTCRGSQPVGWRGGGFPVSLREGSGK